MAKIFNEAKDYRTVTKKISPEQLKAIEKRLGSKLLPGQRETFQYYEMLDSKGEVLGYIIAASQKGEYGAIEFVFGLDKNKKINGIYIQRARERDKEFKKESFLKQFIGVGIEEIDKLEQAINPVRSKSPEAIAPPLAGTSNVVKAKKTTAASALLLGIKKELITFKLLKLIREVKDAD